MPTLTDLRNWAHSLVPIVGFLVFLLGSIQQGLAQYDPSISTKYSAQLMLIGGILATASKAIDSLNDALGGTPTPTTPKA